MRPLGEPQERKKVKQNLKNPRATYLDPRKAGKSALTGPLDGLIGGLYFGSSVGGSRNEELLQGPQNLTQALTPSSCRVEGPGSRLTNIWFKALVNALLLNIVK
jgi:hypothetical protein